MDQQVHAGPIALHAQLLAVGFEEGVVHRVRGLLRRAVAELVPIGRLRLEVRAHGVGEAVVDLGIGLVVRAGQGVAEVDVGQGRAGVAEVRVFRLQAGEDGDEVALLLHGHAALVGYLVLARRGQEEDGRIHVEVGLPRHGEEEACEVEVAHDAGEVDGLRPERLAVEEGVEFSGALEDPGGPVEDGIPVRRAGAIFVARHLVGVLACQGGEPAGDGLKLLQLQRPVVHAGLLGKAGRVVAGCPHDAEPRPEYRARHGEGEDQAVELPELLREADEPVDAPEQVGREAQDGSSVDELRRREGKVGAELRHEEMVGVRHVLIHPEHRALVHAQGVDERHGQKAQERYAQAHRRQAAEIFLVSSFFHRQFERGRGGVPPRRVSGLFEHRGVLCEILYAGVDGRGQDDYPAGRHRPIRDGQHQQDEADHGGGGLYLAGPGGGDDLAALHGHEAQARHRQLPRHDDYRRPGGEEARVHIHEHDRDDEQLVRQGVQELAEVRDLIVVPCDVAVHEVGDGGEGEDAQRPVHVTGEVQVHEHQHGGDEQHADDRYLAGCR